MNPCDKHEILEDLLPNITPTWKHRVLEMMQMIALTETPVTVELLYSLFRDWAELHRVELSRTYDATIRRALQELRDEGLVHQLEPGSGVWQLTERS